MKKRLPLLLALSLSLLVGCSSGKPVDNKETRSPETEPPQQRQMISLDDYTTVYGKYADALITDSARSLTPAVKKELGVTLTIGSDEFKRADFEDLSLRREILIGETDRDESRDLLASLKPSSFAVSITGNKVLLLGTSDSLTVRAVDYFKKKVITDSDNLWDGFLYTETVRDPSSVTLEDHSKNVTNPRIVKTVYPTEDVVIADIIPTEDGYAVIADGTADCTAGIQKALDTCYKHGGGTVYLPSGIYAICGQLRIPEFVTLRGDWQDPDTGSDYGTVIEIWSKPNNDIYSGTIMLGGSGGVYGLTFYYPLQSETDIKPYPFTLYADGLGNRYMMQTVKNVTVLNGYRGIGACCSGGNAHEQLTVDNLKGTFLKTAAEVYNQADVGTWQDVKVSSKYWKEIGGGREKPDGATLDEYIRNNTIGLVLGDLEWTEFHNLNVDGCKVGINIVKGKRIEFAGSIYDVSVTNCTTGIKVDSLDTRWGMLVARGKIEGGITNRTGGTVKICGLEVIGKNSGTVVKTDGDLSQYAVRSAVSIVKPVEKLYVADLPKASKNKDASSDLQKILDEAGKTGGVVYVPGGIYRFSAPINVPSGVELRGSASLPTRDQGGDYTGTLFLCYIKGTVNDTPFITLNEGAGLNGIRINYPENSPYNSDLKTPYAVKGNGKNVYLLNCSIAGAAYGVDFRGCDNHFIKKVTTCCYYVTYCLGGKNGTLIGCLQNGTVLTRCSIPGRVKPLSEDKIFTVLFDPILRKSNYFIKLEGADGENVLNTFAYGCSTFVTCTKSENNVIVNIGCDNIGGGQTRMASGSMTVINAMRYNGQSFVHAAGTLNLFNRLTINDKSEATYSKTK